MTVTAIIFPHCALDHLNILNDLKNSRIKNILTQVETKSLTFLIFSLKMYNKKTMEIGNLPIDFRGLWFGLTELSI